MALEISATSSSTADEIGVARQAEYVAFLHRVPFALDAFRLGFLTGFREDCTYQQQQYMDLELPVGMLDNDFRNPDLNRYVKCWRNEFDRYVQEVEQAISDHSHAMPGMREFAQLPRAKRL